MKRPEINEYAEEQVGRLIPAQVRDAWESVCKYIGGLEEYADFLESVFEAMSTEKINDLAAAAEPAQPTVDGLHTDIANLRLQVADAQARLHSIGLLTR